MTAGQFANLTGLTPGAVTGLIDRLERAGAVTRKVDPDDRRKVIIKTASSLRAGAMGVYFESLMSGIDRLYKDHSDHELRVIQRHMKAMANLLHAETGRLRSIARTEHAPKRVVGR
jgi:DNA-binding MarR family transcriptional regulator